MAVFSMTGKLENALEPVTRRIFKPLFAEVVREFHEMSLRPKC